MDANSIDSAVWLEVGSLLVNLARALAWPVAAFFILRLFRHELQALLPRLRRAGPGGVEFEASQQRKQATAIADADPGELRPVPGIERTPAIEQIERKLRESLQQFHEEERLNVAMATLAATRLDAHFAHTYNRIFGSQIRALRNLNQRGGAVPIDEAQQYFEGVKSEHSVFSNWTFGQYLNFLKQVMFIEERDNHIFLTDIGKAFLVFLVNYRLIEDKPL